MDSTADSRLELPVRRRNPLIEILPIAAGCLGVCTYCQTRLARGRLVSFPTRTILDRARRAVDQGVREIWITAQDVGAYGRDRGESLLQLLESLCAIEGDYRVRLGMSSPVWIEESLPAWMDLLAHPRIFKFLHVPVQSGSDRVLADMKRTNTAAQFAAIAAAFSQRFPSATLMTDVIVGYPTETDEDFEQTLELLKRTRPVAVNRSRFSPRPGTAAAWLKGLPDSVISERMHRLNDLAHGLARDYHARLVGTEDRVLACEHKSNGTTLAHNEAYRPVVLTGHLPLCHWYSVCHTEATDYHLKSRLIALKASS